MRIVDIADFFSERGGGVRSYLGELASEGARHGHEVVVVAPGPRDVDESFKGGRLVRFAGPAMPYDPSYHLLWRVDRILALLREVRPDVVQASSPYLPAVLVARARAQSSSNGASLKSFVYHSDQISTYVRPVLAKIGNERLSKVVLKGVNMWPRMLSRAFDLTIAPSKAIATDLESIGCERVHCVNFGIRDDIFGPDRARPEAKKKMLGALADQPNAALAIVACRFAVEKRVEQLIDAIAAVNEQGHPLAAVILGDGPELQRLQARATRLPQVTFPGFLPREEYAALLASADVFVHGGAAETFGFVLGEALISGVPIVAPEAGAALDFARDALSEVYPPYAGPSAIAEAIVRTLTTPRSVREASALSAKRRVRTTTQHFDDLFSLYTRELDAKRSRKNS